MSAELVPIEPPGPPLVIAAGGRDGLATAFLATIRNAHTRRARASDLDDFAGWLGLPTADAAATALVGAGHGIANAQALTYRAHLDGRGLAAATVNRRLATLRELVRTARTVGLIAWTLEVRNHKAQPYRDTRGCGADGWERILAAAEAAADAGTPQGLRDVALLRTLYEPGLRRGEVVALDLADVDFEGLRVRVLGKHRTQAEWLSLPWPTADALADWIDARGSWPGPLFVRLDRAAYRGPERLTGEGVREVVRAAGVRAGIKGPVRPHGLRHAAITEVLDRNGGDLRAAARFSRHKDLRTLGHYDDNRRDIAGAMARLIARPSAAGRRRPAPRDGSGDADPDADP